VLVVPFRKAARARRRTTGLDKPARDLQEDLARSARILRRDVTSRLVGGGAIQRIARRAEKAAGDRVVFQETVDLEGIFEEYRLRVAGDLNGSAVRSYNLSGQNTLVTLGGRGNFELRNPRILAALEERANMLAGGVVDSVFDGIRDTIRVGLYDERKGVEEIARRLSDRFDILERSRARMIARTETLVAIERATQESFVENGIAEKQWAAAILNPTPPRPSHMAAHGQTVRVLEPFKVGDSNLMHPGDPDGPAKEIINCRCDELAMIPEFLDVTELWMGEAA
jgi:hypothetical protein